MDRWLQVKNLIEDKLQRHGLSSERAFSLACQIAEELEDKKLIKRGK